MVVSTVMCTVHHTDCYRLVFLLNDKLKSILHRLSEYILSQHLRVQQFFLSRETETLQSSVHTPSGA